MISATSLYQCSLVLHADRCSYESYHAFNHVAIVGLDGKSLYFTDPYALFAQKRRTHRTSKPVFNAYAAFLGREMFGGHSIAGSLSRLGNVDKILSSERYCT